MKTRKHFRGALLRMRPYRTVDDKIDGVVITFVDITERKEMEERLRSLANKAGDWTRAQTTITKHGKNDGL